jgi:hypothetical protein
MLKDLERAIDKVKLLSEEQQRYAASVLEQIFDEGSKVYQLSAVERDLVL